jgi:hypothetical protein
MKDVPLAAGLWADAQNMRHIWRLLSPVASWGRSAQGARGTGIARRGVGARPPRVTRDESASRSRLSDPAARLTRPGLCREAIRRTLDAERSAI